MLDRTCIENGIWRLVEAANAAGFQTFSSCEGHFDEREIHISFFASNEDARHVHEVIYEIQDQLLCAWHLRAGFIIRNGQWVLGWRLENNGSKASLKFESEEAFFRRTTEDGRKDVARLVNVFKQMRLETSNLLS